jgi:hypothetical protein
MATFEILFLLPGTAGGVCRFGVQLGTSEHTAQRGVIDGDQNLNELFEDAQNMFHLKSLRPAREVSCGSESRPLSR